MDYVNVPKDILKIREKYLFGLGKRELISLAVAGVIGLPLYFKFKDLIGVQAIYIMLIVIIPIIFAGFYEDDGIYLEKKLLYIIKFYTSKPIRVYKSNNFYKQIENKAILNKKIIKVIKIK
nr:PrgI family protein [uncultured Tyzzerella sp.]